MEQLCCKSSRSSRNLLRTPRSLLFDHRVENNQELTYAGRQGDFLDFPFGQQALIKSFDHRVETSRCKDGHVEYGTNIGTAPSDMHLAFSLAPITRVWSDSDQRGNLFLRKSAELRHL
jgi:hypothetical protein